MIDPLPLWLCLLAVVAAAGLDIAANLMLSKSEGFTRKGFSFGALLLVGLAFSCLAVAVRGMDLSVAYSLWGGFGILGTALGGWFLLGQRLRTSAWLGMAMLIGGMTIIQLS